MSFRCREQKVGAEKGLHTTRPTTDFSGSRVRRFDTHLGSIYLLKKIDPQLTEYIMLGDREGTGGSRSEGD